MSGTKPELLAPAGGMEALVMALEYGADAMYLAGKDFGMRGASDNFDEEELRQVVKLAHGLGKRVYVTCNTLPRNDEIDRIPAFMELVQDAGADAVIASDMGVMAIWKRCAPKVELHVSTQTGVVNHAAATVLHDLGASRVVLARELSLDEIAGIRARIPSSLELEAFCHGSMCMSFSGRCVISNYLTGRDANRGLCAQPCRWKYALMEEQRPGEYFPVFEGEEGSYILNSRDLCMIGHLGDMLLAGISSLKIEGRSKTAYYCATVTNAYRQALDHTLRGEDVPSVWLNEVEKVSHRPYYSGFYYGRDAYGQFARDTSYIRGCEFTGLVEECSPDGDARIRQRNRFFAGDELELLSPGLEPVRFTAQGMRNTGGEEIDAAPHPMMEVFMKLPRHAARNSIIRRNKEI